MSQARQTLNTLRAAKVLDAVDLHVALRLGMRGDIDDPSVLTALALAVRAPRHGHVCIDLATVDTAQLQPPETDIAPPELPSDRKDWVRTVASAGLVRTHKSDPDRPFHLAGSRLYTNRYWNYQARVAQHLHALATRPLRAPRDVEQMQAALNHLFQPPGGTQETTLNRQRLAGAIASLRDLLVITGGPGMGKTWTVRNILALALLDHPTHAPALRIALAAPSGKAAVRMREALAEDLRTGLIPALSRAVGPDQAQTIAGRILRLEAHTLHRLLGWQPATPTRFKHNQDQPLPYDLVVVDECSMIDLAMMAKLLDAIGPDTRLVLLGDPHQLASVEAGTVLADICGQTPAESQVASDALRQALRDQLSLTHTDTLAPVQQLCVSDAIVRFNKNHRFSADSPIGQCAQACLSEPVDIPSTHALFLPGSDLERLDHHDGALSPAALKRIRSFHKRVVDELDRGPAGQADPVYHRRILDAMAEHRVLCAHRRGPLGSVRINQQLTALMGGKNAARQRHFLGQPIIVRVNDTAVGRANGDVGIVVQRQGELIAAFPGPDPLPAPGALAPDHLALVEYLSLARLPDHETCFAMTIHKAQGSQWPHITVVLPDTPSPVLTKELLYTAITRARRSVTVLGSAEILGHALASPISRASGLADALQAQASQ